MRKTGFLFLLLLTTQTLLAAFPKPVVTDCTQATLPANSSPFLSADTSEVPERKPSLREQMLLDRKLALQQMRQRMETRKQELRRINWVPAIGGFLMGFTGVGFVISRFIHNQDLRKGAKLGFKVLLIAIGAYLLLLLFILLLFASLGLIK